MSRFRRKRYLVHHLQYRLLGSTFLYFFILFAAAAIIVFAPFVLQLGESDPGGEASYAAALALLALHSHFWPLFLLLLLFVLVHSVLISHRIGGPLYKLRSVFEAIKRGDISQSVRFRKRDYLKGEEEDLNQMLTSLRSRINQIRQHALEVEAIVAELTHSEDGVSLRNLTEELENRVIALNRAIDFFDTEESIGTTEH